MIKVVSYGGGVQSTALLVLAATGKIEYTTFLFCNVGEDSENPETLAYVEQIAKPYAENHGIELIELQKTRFGETETLYERLTRPGSKSIGIPVRLARSGAPANRTCTQDFKIKVIVKWLREHGATKDNPAISALGISLDEWHRMRTDSGVPYQKLAYPLIDMRIDRAQCVTIIEQAELPVPPKSSCYFCPFHSMRVWQEMRIRQPDLFQKACELESIIIARMDSFHKGDAAYMTDKLKPLAQVTTDYEQGNMFEDDQAVCESGYCMV